MDGLTVGIIGVLVTVVTSIATMAYWLGGRFQKIESNIRNIYNDIKNIYETLETKHNDMKTYINSRIEDLQKGFRGDMARLSLGFQSYQEFFIELLASEGVLRAERAQLAKNELMRVIKIVKANPLTEEEVKRLEELLLRDELSLEEALELREIARKVVREYGEYVEAWKLHAYASLMVGLAMARQRKTS